MKKLLTVPVLAISVLLITNLITAGFLWHEKDKQAAIKDYPYIDVARNLIPQKHFIVNIQPLREKFQKIARNEPAGTVSIYYEFLNTGANIQINNDARYYPASLVKLPTAMVAMKKVEKGEWKMGNQLVLFEEDKDNRYGTLYQKPVGTRFTIEQLLKALLVESDNTAHHMLMRNLTESELDELKNAIGLDDLFNERQEISAKEYSRMFRALYNSSFLKRSGSQQILTWLTQTKFNDYLPSGVPKDIPFAHKIGEDDVEKNYLDSGIIYAPNRPSLITVMIKEHDQAAAGAIMKQVSQAAYEYVENYE